MRTWRSGVDAFDPRVRKEVERLLAASPALRDVLKVADEALPMTGRDSIGDLFRVNLLDVCREVERAAVLEHGRQIVHVTLGQHWDPEMLEPVRELWKSVDSGEDD